MQHKLFTLILIAAVLMLALAGCGKTRPPAASSESEPVTQQTEQSSDTTASATENLPADTEEPTAEVPREDETPEEEPWKTALAEELLEKYGVLPEYYEDLGDGIYQVYVEVGGEIVPFVTVDSATGDYHG